MTEKSQNSFGSKWAQKSKQALIAELRNAHAELEQTNSELLQLTLEMDDRVAERTQALRKSEAELREHRDHLQELVDERTRKLETTNRRLVENLAELRASEERFESLVLTIPDIVYRIDRQGRFTYINQAIERLGYRAEDLLGRHFSAIILPQEVAAISREVVLAEYKDRRTGDDKAPRLFDERRTGPRRTTGLEVRLLRKAGGFRAGVMQELGSETVVVEVNSTGLYEAEEGEESCKMFVGSVGVIRDITERKQREESIRRQNLLFDGINRVMLEALACETTEDAEVGAVAIAAELTSSRFGLMRRFAPSATLAVDRLDAAGWQRRGISVKGAARLFGDREIQTLLQEIHRSAGSRFWNRIPGGQPPDGRPVLNNLIGVPLMQADQVCGLLVLANKPGGYTAEDGHTLEALGVAAMEAVSRKELEIKLKLHQEKLEMLVEKRARALKESQAQFIEAEKLGALGVLTAGIAHELNNPMMGMLNYAQYCRKHVPADSKVSGVLADMVGETERCIDIVKNLLTFSRMEEAGQEKMEMIQVGTLLDRVTNLLKYRIEKENVRVTRSGIGGLPEIEAKVSNLQQVFLNLLGNALDALEDVPDRQIRIQAGRQDGYVRISIADNGCGIPAGQRDTIFDPFFTTKPPGKGTGLGLSVCRSIIEAHKGAIRCESSPGKGTTFNVDLPLLPSMSSAERPGG